MIATKNHLPRWTKRVVMNGSGRDPLGLSRVSDNFTELLQPSIIATTNRARYYSLVDTRTVGKTAIDTFSRWIDIEAEDGTDTDRAVAAAPH
jgi:hypothetical protein